VIFLASYDDRNEIRVSDTSDGSGELSNIKGLFFCCAKMSNLLLNGAIIM